MSYHQRMMNIPLGDLIADSGQYRNGHRDARHDAAEIANEADAEIARLTRELGERDARLDEAERLLNRVDAVGSGKAGSVQAWGSVAADVAKFLRDILDEEHMPDVPKESIELFLSRTATAAPAPAPQPSAGPTYRQVGVRKTHDRCDFFWWESLPEGTAVYVADTAPAPATEPSAQHKAECDCENFHGGQCIWPKCNLP